MRKQIMPYGLSSLPIRLVKSGIFIFFGILGTFSIANAADTLYVLRPVIDSAMISNKAEFEKLDKFCGHFTTCFRRSLREMSAGRCGNEFVFIDIDNEEEAVAHAKRNGYLGDFALATKYFQGELKSHANGYVLNIVLKPLNNAIQEEDYALIQFSQIDDFPQELAERLSESFMVKICKNTCNPPIRAVAPYNSDTYRRNLEKMFDLLLQKYDAGSPDVDAVDRKIANLKSQIDNPPEQFELSYYVLQGNFWLIVRSNKPKACNAFIQAKNKYCVGPVYESDLHLLRQYFGEFSKFQDFINDQIRKCN